MSKTETITIDGAGKTSWGLFQEVEQIFGSLSDKADWTLEIYTGGAGYAKFTKRSFGPL